MQPPRQCSPSGDWRRSSTRRRPASTRWLPAWHRARTRAASPLGGTPPHQVPRRGGHRGGLSRGLGAGRGRMAHPPLPLLASRGAVQRAAPLAASRHARVRPGAMCTNCCGTICCLTCVGRRPPPRCCCALRRRCLGEFVGPECDVQWCFHAPWQWCLQVRARHLVAHPCVAHPLQTNPCMVRCTQLCV